MCRKAKIILCKIRNGISICCVIESRALHFELLSCKPVLCLSIQVRNSKQPKTGTNFLKDTEISPALMYGMCLVLIWFLFHGNKTILGLGEDD